MKVGFNILPLKSAHRDRGIGYYTRFLLEALYRHPDIEIQEFINISELKDVDVVHYPWFDFYFHTLPDKKIAPFVVTIHDVIPLRFKDQYPVGLRGKINFFLQKMSLRKCNTIITDSETSEKDIVRFLKIKAKKIRIIPLAADSNFKVLPQSKLIHIKRKYNLPDNFLLYVGDANWVKNLPFLIKSFNNLTKLKNFKDLKLILIGEAFLKKVENIDHPELRSLKELNALIKEFNLDNKIIRLGKIDREELICFYNLATVYVQPSLYEGFGLPVLEAMSCGVPVISSSGGSLKEVGGKAAVYFDPNNHIQFESVISELLNNKPLRLRLSQLGLKQAEKFSWRLAAQKTYEVYENIANL